MLPRGLDDVFKRVLTELHRALTSAQLMLLMQRVLPVLVVSRTLLTVADLVWATGAEASQVRLWCAL